MLLLRGQNSLRWKFPAQLASARSTCPEIFSGLFIYITSDEIIEGFGELDLGFPTDMFSDFGCVGDSVLKIFKAGFIGFTERNECDSVVDVQMAGCVCCLISFLVTLDHREHFPGEIKNCDLFCTSYIEDLPSS